MITRLIIKNFRSIENAQIDIKPLTMIYGQNASGKSSILYAPLVLKNIILNPNQVVDGFFNLIFCNFGGFAQVVFNHKEDQEIEIGIASKTRYGELTYNISFGKEGGNFRIRLEGKLDEHLSVKFPYLANSQKKIQIKVDEGTTEYIWNGITASSTTPSLSPLSEDILRTVNSIVELIKKIDIVPLKRGFSKPYYTPVAVSPYILTEDEMATLLTGGYGYLKNKVHSYVKKIFNKDFQLTSQPGQSLFYLQTIDERGLTSEIVNEGFGINQTIYLLSKALRSDVSTVLIEEPEIHLHPTAQRKLVKAFIDIIKEEKKTLIISTHSEHIVSALLFNVAEKIISPEDVVCYLCKKDKAKTILQEQKINSKGQIEDGLMSFMEDEIEFIKKIAGEK